jgi:hypothetical protein
MDAKTRALEIFENLNNLRIEDGQPQIQSMFIALHSNGDDAEDWYVSEKYIHEVGRAPRNEDSGIIPALMDYLDVGMQLDESVRGEIWTILNIRGRVTARQNALVLRPKE